jgi:rod shape-determining protein MreC
MRFIYTKTFAYFSVILAIALLLIFLHLKGWIKPLESTLAEIPRPFIAISQSSGNYIKSFFSFFGSVAKLNRVNSDLRQQVTDLSEQNALLEQFKLENDTLKKELAYRNTAKSNLISADVISKDPTDFSQTITLNIGSNQSINEGDGVLAQGVFVGKIISVQSFTAKAQLISDPQSAVDAALSATGEIGVLKGSFGSGVALDDISQNVSINKGDRVVTAGLTSNIPKGILIGTIGEIQSQKNDLLQRASVIPAVDLKQLRFVAVIRS